jgi:hypothetical protein
MPEAKTVRHDKDAIKDSQADFDQTNGLLLTAKQKAIRS